MQKIVSMQRKVALASCRFFLPLCLATTPKLDGRSMARETRAKMQHCKATRRGAAPVHARNTVRACICQPVTRANVGHESSVKLSPVHNHHHVAFLEPRIQLSSVFLFRMVGCPFGGKLESIFRKNQARESVVLRGMERLEYGTLANLGTQVVLSERAWLSECVSAKSWVRHQAKQ